MTAIKELYLTCLFLLFSQISALQTGISNETACESSNVTINFIFDLGNDTFLDRSWYKNSSVAANKIARVDGAGSWTVEPQYIGRVAFSGLGGITLYNVKKTDSESYLFVILTDKYSLDGTATTTVNVYVNPNASCLPVIENNSSGNITCKISDACPGKDSIQAVWEGSSVDVFSCPSTTGNTKYRCCAKGDPVTYCYNGSLCTEIWCNGTGKSCELELGLGLGLTLVIQCSITCIIVVIFVCKGYIYAYLYGLLLGLGLGITVQVSWIITVSLISSGNQCKLELGLGLDLGSGIPYVTAYIVAVFLVCKGIPSTVNFGKGTLKGLLFSSVIGIFVVFLINKTLKAGPPEPTGETPEKEPNDKENKTKNKGSSSALSRKDVQIQVEKQCVKSHEEERPPAVHTGTQNKVESKTSSKQTKDRHQPLPPVDKGLEDTPKIRPQPQPPQNMDIKDRTQRGISATIDDTPDLPTETPRPSKLPPLTLTQSTVEEEDASEEPKKKRKKKKKKGQMNDGNPDEEMVQLKSTRALPGDQFDGD